MSYDNEAEFDREEKMDAKLWKRLFNYAMRNRALFVRILLSMLIVAIIDALYPILTRFAIDRFVRPDAAPTTDGMWLFFGIYVALVVAQGIAEQALPEPAVHFGFLVEVEFIVVTHAIAPPSTG